ncbi:hypothetical protein ACVBEF_09260 [Glaciimonas sp. GG7]
MKRTSAEKTPNQSPNSILKSNLGTSRTNNKEGPRAELGTHLGVHNLHYVPLPPMAERHHAAYWTWEKVCTALGGVAILISIVIFFYHMDSNISDVKSDMREEKNKIGNLDEKSTKQTTSIEMVNGSVQRLESEVRRTQDYIQQQKK